MNRGRLRKTREQRTRRLRKRETQGTVKYVQKHKLGTPRDHRPRTKSMADRRGQGWVIFAHEPASPTHPLSDTTRDFLSIISILVLVRHNKTSDALPITSREMSPCLRQRFRPSVQWAPMHSSNLSFAVKVRLECGLILR